MRRHIVLCTILSAVLVLLSHTQLFAGQAGGQTIGGGREIIKVKEGDSRTLFHCEKCSIAACATFAGQGGVSESFAVASTGDRIIGIIPKDDSNTQCMLDLRFLQVECLTGFGDCEFFLRVDQIGPAIPRD